MDVNDLIDPTYVSIFRKSPCLQSVQSGFCNEWIQWACGSALSDVVIVDTMRRLCAEAASNGQHMVVGYEDLNNVKDIKKQIHITDMFRSYVWGDEPVPASLFVCTSHWADALVSTITTSDRAEPHAH